MKIGEVRVAEDADFDAVKKLLDNHEGWKLEYNKSPLRVWTRQAEESGFKMIKMHTVFKDVKASVMYDILHDPGYRKTWDKYMITSQDIGHLNPNNDLGYYSAYCPSPMKNRDFVLQRSWLDRGSEAVIFNHSVFHKDYPQMKDFIRATSFLTGYVVRPCSNNGGCEFGYVTHSDPKGSLPPWIVNKLTQIFAPAMMKQLHKACCAYESWKSQQPNPNFKPWLYPEQITSPKLDISKCLNRELSKSSELLEDYNADENSIRDENFVTIDL